MDERSSRRPVRLGGLPVGTTGAGDGEPPEKPAARARRTPHPGPPRGTDPDDDDDQDDEDFDEPREVVVRDIDIPFWSMVTFMVKAAIAFIPAAIILAVVGASISAILAALGLSLLR